MHQLGTPTVVHEQEIARERTLGGAIQLCAKAAGYDLDKELQRLMDLCGNHAPVLWMLHQLGYDIGALRKRESELEKQLRTERELRESAEFELAILRKYVGVLK